MAPIQSPLSTSNSSSTSLPTATDKRTIPIKPLVVGSPHTPYFTPLQPIAPGTANHLTPQTPTLFHPLTIRSKTLKNRIIVSPMCQYSSSPSGPDIGTLTPYHIATLGHYALKGAALVFTEALAVQAVGRISPTDAGLWGDHQIEGLKAVADFVHSQDGLIGVQLAHAGRKASVNPPWVMGTRRAGWEVGGFGPGGVVGPSGGVDQIWDGKSEDDPSGSFWEPRELTIPEIETIVDDFRSAAERAVKAGVDVVELHAAHGYLICQFLSPVSNRRRDGYGGDFWGRTRLLREVTKAVREVLPEGIPLFVRVSATEWLEGSEVEKSIGGSWTVDETVKLARLLPEWGVDMLDVSSGSNHRDQDVSGFRMKDYQTRNAARIRKEVKADGKNLLIGAVGLITEAEQARDLVQEGTEPTLADEARAVKELTDTTGGKDPHADVVFVARQFMREPEWVLRVAAQLEVEVAWPVQFARAKFPKL